MEPPSTARTLTLMDAAAASLDHAATILPANAKSASVLSLRERTPWEICTPSRACLTATICTRRPPITCVDALAFWFMEVGALPTLLKDASSSKAKALATWSSLVPLWRWSLNRFQRLYRAFSHISSPLPFINAFWVETVLFYFSVLCNLSMQPLSGSQNRTTRWRKRSYILCIIYFSYLFCSSWVNIDYNHHNSIPFNVILLQAFVYSSCDCSFRDTRQWTVFSLFGHSPGSKI